MFDFSKLSEKVIVTILLIIGLLVSGLFILSYTSNQPFSIYDKEFGFGSNELQKKTAEFENFRNETAKNVVGMQRLLTEARTENLQLKKTNNTLLSQQQERARQDGAMWFPIDDLAFIGDGTFSTQDGKRGREKWTSKESELTLQLIGIDESDVVLGTNLPPPENKIRIQRGHQIFIYMSKWDYRLSTKDVYSDNATVRVERRPKPQGT